MTDDDAQDPLRELGRRIEGAKRTLGQEAKPDRKVSPAAGSAFAVAWRVAIELVGAVVVMGAIGWVVDGWLGTRPWLTIVMFFLGVAAGMMNVWHAVQTMGKAAGRGQNGQPDAGRQEDDED